MCKGSYKSKQSVNHKHSYFTMDCNTKGVNHRFKITGVKNKGIN